jgi:hypothetical protein
MSDYGLFQCASVPEKQSLRRYRRLPHLIVDETKLVNVYPWYADIASRHEDIYTAMAMFMFHVGYSDVTKEQRTAGKRRICEIIYGVKTLDDPPPDFDESSEVV